jgi:hypothetical protein
MSPVRALSLVGVMAVLLVGCGPGDPFTGDRSNASPDLQRVEREGGAPESGELPGRAPSAVLDEPDRFPEAGQKPQVTLALAARLYGNWTSTTAAGQLRRMAALSVGQAHAELRQAAAQAAVDRQQRGARSRATVEAISVRGDGPRRRGLVVTREQIVAFDLPSEGWRYRVTIAVLERRPDGWVISRWTPQP